jgi:hypothetical protein
MKLKLPILALLAASVLTPGIRAEAATNLVSNPDFSLEFTDWTVDRGPTNQGLIAISSYNKQLGTYWPYMWPTSGLTDSPNGGNFLAADGFVDFQAPFSQVISGLEIGATYDLSFEYAGSQEYLFDVARPYNTGMCCLDRNLMIHPL